MRIVRFIFMLAATMMPLKAHAQYYGSEKMSHRTINENSPVSQCSNGTQTEHSTRVKPANFITNTGTSDLEEIFKKRSDDVSEENAVIIGRLTGESGDMTLLTTALPILAVSGVGNGNAFYGHHALDSKAKAAVEGYLTYFSKKIKSSFAQWLTYGSRYVPLMKQVLEEHNIPEDLVYLSLIESGFNIFARSNSHAVGPWQLMASTATRLNLKINYWVDERHDPIKSTKAASSYLRFLFEKFGSWDLAIAAYNAGELNIENALRRSNTTSFWKLFSSSHIRQETKQFVPKFLAAREIGQMPEKYGLDDVDVRTPFAFDVVIISPPATLGFVAEAAGTTVEKIRELNPEIKQWCIPPYMRKYRLRIPVGKKDSFLAAYDAASEGERYPLASYTSTKGDTLAMIARKARVQLDILRDLNRLSSTGTLTPGMVIYLPPNTTVAEVGSSANPQKDTKAKLNAKNKKQPTAKLHAQTTERKPKVHAQTAENKPKVHAKTAENKPKVHAKLKTQKAVIKKLVKTQQKPAAHTKTSPKKPNRA
ncbi:lytic transglycosylase [Candidatus Magnetobacterium bavaricum]|uniref:Lytic transglycosylase n=1 Tax=Candidatus Magnetobacterium bavaricum TaxID=29290 RepID=A0A0F3GZV1_9BACT|nr:lytic transglycosylase [Candidatus Magnetobacterium bavaricum]